MEIHYTSSKGTLVVALVDRLDDHATPELQKNNATWQAGPLIIDLSGVDYLSNPWGERLLSCIGSRCPHETQPLPFLDRIE